MRTDQSGKAEEIPGMLCYAPGAGCTLCYALGKGSTILLCSSWDKKYSTVMLLGQEVQYSYAPGTGSTVLLCFWDRKYSYVMLLGQEGAEQ